MYAIFSKKKSVMFGDRNKTTDKNSNQIRNANDVKLSF